MDYVSLASPRNSQRAVDINKLIVNNINKGHIDEKCGGFIERMKPSLAVSQEWTLLMD